MTRIGKESILLLFVIVALPNIVCASVEKSLEFSLNDDIESIPGEVVRNSRSKYHACRFKIVPSRLKDIVKLMHNSKTNVIVLNVYIKSLNKTFNDTRVLTAGIKWANEIGRTLISLTAQAENSLSMVLSSYTSTLTAGVYDANIVVSEVTGRCLLPQNHALNPIIFNLIVRQLYKVSEDDTDYQLCLPYMHKHDVTGYKCCAIVGEKNIPICSDYSSIVTKIFLNLALVTIFFFVFIAFPIILEYLSHFKEENKHYKISDSPMSFSSILHTVLIEGHGPGRSFGRKLLIAIFVFVTVLPAPNGNDDLVYSILSYVLLCPWVIIFPFFDEHNLNENDDRHVNNKFECCGYVFEDPIAIIGLPFNLKLWWHKVNNDWPLFYDHLKLNLNPEITERTGLLEQVDSEQPPQERSKFSGFIEIMKYRLSILFLLIFYLTIGLACLCLFSVWLLNRYYSNFAKKRGKSKLLRYLTEFQFFITLTLFTYSFMKFLLLVFYFAVGLFLNGQVYGPYFVPLSTILFFSWINWRSSVEIKYLVLNTKILEVCSKSNPVESSNQINENDGNASVAPQASARQYTINWNMKGDPIIPKELYEKIREMFLPYDKILFNYFQGVFFVVLFAYFLYIIMSLAQKSGVSESVQIIGAMAATTIPFIFDLVWKTNSDEQKEANDMALKFKLKQVLVVREIVRDSDGVIREISVEFADRIENTSNTL